MQLPSESQTVSSRTIFAFFFIPLLLLLTVVVWFRYGSERPTSSAFDVCGESIVLPLWEREYAAPVVSVQAEVSVPAFVHPCSSEMTECSLREGLYHPWAENPGRYITKKAPVVYRSEKALVSNLSSYPQGTEIQLRGLAGEERCMVSVGDDAWISECPALPSFTLLRGDPESIGTRFFEVSCSDGMAWIELNDELFLNPSIAKGIVNSDRTISSP